MREFLKGIELENGEHLSKEIIEKITAEHGKEITAEKEKYSSLQTEVNELKESAKENQKTIDGLNKTIEENNKSLENMQTITNENNNLKAQIQIKDSNVKKEFAEFVTSKVSSQVNDETDFATALESYKKDNPQYFGDTVIKKVQSAPTLNGGGAPTKTTSDIMNDILRGAKNTNE